MAPTQEEQQDAARQQREACAPEDAIPDKPENRNAREFLKSAPSKGLWLPMGVSVKVMQCWRCKTFGHRTGDRECPMATAGNLLLDAERQAREDPMAKYVASPLQREMTKAEKKQAKREQLAALLEEVRCEAAEKKKRMKKRMKNGKRSKSSSGKRKRRRTISALSCSSSSASSSSSSSSFSSDSESSDLDTERRRKTSRRNGRSRRRTRDRSSERKKRSRSPRKLTPRIENERGSERRNLISRSRERAHDTSERGKHK